MEKRKLGAKVVVVVIAIAIVAIAIGAFLLLRGGLPAPTQEGFPMYPGTQEFSGLPIENALAMLGQGQGGLPTGWSGKVYTASVSPDNITEWYRTQMVGWEKFFDNTVNHEYGDYVFTSNILLYTKENDAAIIWTFEHPKYGVVVVVPVHGPAQGLGEFG